MICFKIKTSGSIYSGIHDVETLNIVATSGKTSCDKKNKKKKKERENRNSVRNFDDTYNCTRDHQGPLAQLQRTMMRNAIFSVITIHSA